ncbi:MAG: transcription antitermination factor NusB [Candidatus Spyradocola sp.]|jgi:N utilization substance protein B
MARKEARQIAMQLIYQYELGGEGIASTIEETMDKPNLTVADREYIDQVVLGAVDRAGELDARIAAHAQGWTLERIARVDLAILRLALFEMLYREDVPTGVAINEAVELAHGFSGDKAASFINGILGTIAREEDAAAPDAAQDKPVDEAETEPDPTPVEGG